MLSPGSFTGLLHDRIVVADMSGWINPCFDCDRRGGVKRRAVGNCHNIVDAIQRERISTASGNGSRAVQQRSIVCPHRIVGRPFRTKPTHQIRESARIELQSGTGIRQHNGERLIAFQNRIPRDKYRHDLAGFARCKVHCTGWQCTADVGCVSRMRPTSGHRIVDSGRVACVARTSDRKLEWNRTGVTFRLDRIRG